MSYPFIVSEYSQCISVLENTGILSTLPGSKSKGIIGIDQNEYPIPTHEQVENLLTANKKLVDIKRSQGFNRLELIPMALGLPQLMEIIEKAINRHLQEGKIYLTRNSDSDPLLPARVNKKKVVWVWDKLNQAITTNELVYFPEEYTTNHKGQTKSEVIDNRQICAFPGWSVGLVENLPFIPKQGQGETVGGRMQLEISHSPNEYLQIMRQKEYSGETGKTLEDFIVKFLMRLELKNEISNNIYDDNAMWCLANYYKLPWADVIPTVNWLENVGRLRFGMHRSNNKLCTKSAGASTTVRLPGHF